VLLLDFDGVLVDSTAIKVGAFETLYADTEPAFRARVIAWHVRHGGISRIEKFRKFEAERLGRTATSAEIEALSRRFEAIVEDAVIACPPIPGAFDLLGVAAGRDVPCHVISGTPEPELRRIVSARGWQGHFASVRGSPALKPALIRETLAAAGMAPARATMVGDSLTDFDAAVATGAGFLGVAGRDGSDPFPAGTVVLPDLTAAASVLDLA